MIQFQTPNGETTGSQLEIPSDITLAQLQVWHTRKGVEVMSRAPCRVTPLLCARIGPFLCICALLQELINDVLKNEEKLPYVFYLNDEEIVESLAELIRYV